MHSSQREVIDTLGYCFTFSFFMSVAVYGTNNARETFSISYI